MSERNKQDNDEEWEDEHLCQTCWDVFPRLVLEAWDWVVDEKKGRPPVKFFEGPEALSKSSETCACCKLVLSCLPSKIPIDEGFLLSATGRSKDMGGRKVLDSIDVFTEKNGYFLARMDIFADIGRIQSCADLLISDSISRQCSCFGK
jgi:hypothetical protein